MIEENAALTVDEGWVQMYHPDIEDSDTLATQEAYDEVWAEKGWLEGTSEGASRSKPKTSSANKPEEKVE